MTFVQAMTGSGRLAAQCIYFPGPETVLRRDLLAARRKQGRPAFLQVLQQITAAWEQRRNQLTGSSEQLHQRLLEITQRSVTNSILLTNAVLRNAGRELKTGYDSVNGGLVAHRNFLHQPSVISPAVRRPFSRPGAVNMVLHTLDRMAPGNL